MTDSEMLFEKVKAKVEALKAAHNIPSSNQISASTPHKPYPLDKTIINGEQICLDHLPNVSQGPQLTADADPLVQDGIHKLEDFKVCTLSM